MQISEKRNTLSFQPGGGETTALRLGQYYLEDEEETECSFSHPHPPLTPFNLERGENSRVCKGKGDSTILILLHQFCRGWGLNFSLPTHTPQEGAEPHLWALQGEGSQEIQWRREGWQLPGGGARAGKAGGGTEWGHRGQLQLALLRWQERFNGRDL